MLRVIRSALVLIAVAAPAAAEDKPVGLPPKEAAEGWVMLFDGETTFGWKVDGEATVKDGALLLGGGQKPTVATPTHGLDTYDLRLVTHGVAVVAFNTSGGSSRFALADHTDISVRPGPAEGLGVNGGVGPDKVNRSDVKVTTDVPTTLRLEVPAGATLQVKEAKLKPAGLKPLFNGNDLTGWHAFKDPAREKATFTVTPAGELHVLGGPGDLQTDAKFADFVLQAEVKTNGPTVNSGIFFRCVPGQYQNGYECQIQNAFKDGDRTKPADGGTGAIYRRQGARRVVPNDKEWFTLTIAANGPHLATWVNGYPTASWTDDRKPHENPRTGLRTEAGHISIQGHNPPMAADVLYRNIRIAEVKGK